MDKRSTINSIDFASNLINYHHTLWWGDTLNHGLVFSLLEQTVFIDDSSLKGIIEIIFAIFFYFFSQSSYKLVIF